MASDRETFGARLLASLKFWTVVAVLCAIVGTGMYYFGRDYVGRHLHEMEVEHRAPEIRPQPGAPALADDVDTSANPPVEPLVTVREREPTSREERRARRELEEPQDGAQLNAAREAEAEDDDTGEQPDEAAEPERDQERAGEGGFVVVAGSFADEANAERQVQRLAERGYQPFITTQVRDGITYRRVNVGMFESREEAENVREKLSSQGFDAAVWSEG